MYRLAGIESWERIDCMDPIPEIVRRLKDMRPTGITGYAGVLSRVADFMGPDQADLRPQFVLSAS